MTQNDQNLSENVVKPLRVLKAPDFDPLDIKNMDEKLIVFDYETPFNLPYSIVLNKFNTVPDHVSFCVSASFFVDLKFSTNIKILCESTHFTANFWVVLVCV